ncbi:sensor histidine kinase [Dehalobacter sp. DCM]|uniref:sensor histidine kinase n=1 Tax=Dehalobacter sp. DCM TaxID=2907827 RepID=UPI00308200F7|nr:sensor histidine kinase [Dehalobacter sp. DCM]
MITMGLFAIVQRDSRIINLSIVKSIKYLGLFGIFHGVGEWLSMIIRLEICHPHYYVPVYNTNSVIKAISFTFLLYFGLSLLPMREKDRRFVLKLPVILLVICLIGYSGLIIRFGAAYHIYHPIYTVFALRYILGFLSCMISAVALYINAAYIKKTKSEKISSPYKNLAWVFVIYGFIEGLLVSKADFFPANVINKDLLGASFSLAPLIIKALVGFVILLLLVKVIDTFTWEQEEKIDRLEKLRIAAEERSKLGIEIHDGIIQELFAAGLKVEYLSGHKSDEQCDKLLEEIKRDLNSSIDKIRSFISEDAHDMISLNNLKESLDKLASKLNPDQKVRITISCRISPYTSGYLPPIYATQIYYIIQEALTNVMKHAGATEADVLIESRQDHIYLTVTDNGIGFHLKNQDPNSHFGLRGMQDRAEQIGGTFTIERTMTGTLLEVEIPWKELKNGKK